MGELAVGAEETRPLRHRRRGALQHLNCWSRLLFVRSGPDARPFCQFV